MAQHNLANIDFTRSPTAVHRDEDQVMRRRTTRAFTLSMNALALQHVAFGIEAGFYELSADVTTSKLRDAAHGNLSEDVSSTASWAKRFCITFGRWQASMFGDSNVHSTYFAISLLQFVVRELDHEIMLLRAGLEPNPGPPAKLRIVRRTALTQSQYADADAACLFDGVETGAGAIDTVTGQFCPFVHDKTVAGAAICPRCYVRLIYLHGAKPVYLHPSKAPRVPSVNRSGGRLSVERLAAVSPRTGPSPVAPEPERPVPQIPALEDAEVPAPVDVQSATADEAQPHPVDSPEAVVGDPVVVEPHVPHGDVVIDMPPAAAPKVGLFRRIRGFFKEVRDSALRAEKILEAPPVPTARLPYTGEGTEEDGPNKDAISRPPVDTGDGGPSDYVNFVHVLPRLDSNKMLDGERLTDTTARELCDRNGYDFQELITEVVEYDGERRAAISRNVKEIRQAICLQRVLAYRFPLIVWKVLMLVFGFFVLVAVEAAMSPTCRHWASLVLGISAAMPRSILVAALSTASLFGVYAPYWLVRTSRVLARAKVRWFLWGATTLTLALVPHPWIFVCVNGAFSWAVLVWRGSKWKPSLVVVTTVATVLTTWLPSGWLSIVGWFCLVVLTRYSQDVIDRAVRTAMCSTILEVIPYCPHLATCVFAEFATGTGQAALDQSTRAKILRNACLPLPDRVVARVYEGTEMAVRTLAGAKSFFADRSWVVAQQI